MDGIAILKPNYKYAHSVDLNGNIENILNALKDDYEATLENLNDLIIDDTERRCLELHELDPIELSEVAILSAKLNCLNDCISQLKQTIYAGYEEHPFPTKKGKAESMNRKDSLTWITSTVKPYIIKGLTTQYIIAEELGIHPTTINKRLHRAFGINWKEYVRMVNQGEL